MTTLIVPHALDATDMKMRMAPSYTPDLWLKCACDSFDRLVREGPREGQSAPPPRRMSLGLQLRIIGRPGRIGALERFLERAGRAPGGSITTRRTIAAHCSGQVPAAT